MKNEEEQGTLNQGEGIAGERAAKEREGERVVGEET